MIDLFKSLYNTIDMVTVVKGLVKVSYSTVDAETILDAKLAAEENAKYAAIAEALAEYYSGRTLVIQPAD